jgi:hypothetical protein
MRLAKGLLVSPEGWPANSPIWASTIDSYKVLWRCHRKLTPSYRQFVADAAASKRVHHLRSPREIRAFLDSVKREWAERATEGPLRNELEPNPVRTRNDAWRHQDRFHG